MDKIMNDLFGEKDAQLKLRKEKLWERMRMSRSERTITPENLMTEFNLSKSSAQLYIRNYNKLMEAGYSPDDLTSTENLEDAIQHYKDTTKRTFIMAVIKVSSFLRNISQDDEDELKEFYNRITAVVDTARQQTPQKTEKLDFKPILDRIDATLLTTTDNAKQARLLQDKLMVLINTEIPARRAQDWYDMELVANPTQDIIDDDEMSDNYYNLKRFIFKKYKTFKTHGTQVVKPTENIKSTIREMLQKRGGDLKFLFLNNQNLQMTQSTFNRNLNRVMGVGTNALRKLYANTHCNTEQVREAIAIAKDMGHSLSTAVINYYDRGGCD